MAKKPIPIHKPSPQARFYELSNSACTGQHVVQQVKAARPMYEEDTGMSATILALHTEDWKCLNEADREQIGKDTGLKVKRASAGSLLQGEFMLDVD